VLRSGLEAVPFDRFAPRFGGDGNTHGNTRRSDARLLAGLSEACCTGRNTVATPVEWRASTKSDGYGRGERSSAAGNPLIGDLDPASLPRPCPRGHGRCQATAAFGALCMTR
jgi:hypothetical protein